MKLSLCKCGAPAEYSVRALASSARRETAPSEVRFGANPLRACIRRLLGEERTDGSSGPKGDCAFCGPKVTEVTNVNRVLSLLSHPPNWENRPCSARGLQQALRSAYTAIAGHFRVESDPQSNFESVLKDWQQEIPRAESQRWDAPQETKQRRLMERNGSICNFCSKRV
jgi:hypothetical protein